MGLHAKRHEVREVNPVTKADIFSGELLTQRVYGNYAQMLYARRSPNYHSRPHVHDCEQLNWVAEGEIWMFVEEEGYLLQTGDFMRVPRNLVHWAWNRADVDCVLIETHAPPNVKNEAIRETAFGLYRADEKPALVDPSESFFLRDRDEFAGEVERRVLGL